ncbi:ABC transporter ATP-binding protein [Terrisporobacter mayombei]|uniref:Taurine import ATP-binding protein TauB n=2 Tax=Terrisporobacter mayombei TaxID=1541 RepID=A0ABY9Q3R0_9FIRM|nr:ABC transporter ATP-binding protein [Terrisporobacter mayombei]MCC3867746.1 ABC transporter ATP-binding protein [Terrisporobacter mayombei]WMT82009.1 Taurine import ATP-binding protein TauB [Terrisporobacter mayombei]
MHIQMNSYQTNNKKIIISNLSKKYKDNIILKDIDLHVYDEEIVSIIGPSGCGKSTIFNILSNLTTSDSGEVDINGRFSYMYQKDLLLPYKNIMDNVSLPLILKGEKKKKSKETVKPYFSTFGLEGYENKYPHELSGGMRQRANFMRTFVNSSDIMLLDEPFGALDSITRSSMQNWLLDIKKEIKSTILLITHDIDEAIILSDRIYILSNKPAVVTKEVFVDKRIYNKNNLENMAKLKKEILSYL